VIPSASRRAGDRAGSWTVGPAGTRRWLQGLGAVIDPVDAYAWGWEELRRIEAEMAREADRVRPGASVDEAISLLDETQYVVGADPYRAWLQKRHDWAVEQLHGTHFDIAEPLRTVEVTLARGSTSGAAYYTPPSEDLTRPGRTWWPLGERAWLAARDEARRRPGFDLKRWHTAALDLGPIGLDGLAESLRRIDRSPRSGGNLTAPGAGRQ
jgi:uncharacterized protein (DUF885 family)